MSTAYTVDVRETARVGIRELRKDIGRYVDAAYYADEPTIITKNDEPRAVIVPYEWYAEIAAKHGLDQPEPPRRPRNVARRPWGTSRADAATGE